MPELIEKELSYQIVGAAYKVRDELGFGFLERVFENALVVGLRDIGIAVGQQAPMEVIYLNHVVGTYYADLVVDGRIIVEVKSVEAIIKAHLAQTLNYLRATRLSLGLVLNFNRHSVDVERLVI
jgi:GxxExxY protein